MKLFLTTALAACTLAGAASAQTSGVSPARIPFGDLNLSTASGVATLDARIDAAAQSMCRNMTRAGSRLSDKAPCAAAVRAEAVAQLPTQARARYAAGRQTITL